MSGAMSPSQRRPMPQVAEIKRLASPEVFARGQACRNGRAVSQIVARGDARGDAIVAAVEGSEAEPYRVRLRIEAGRVREWGCSCPYEWGGACKHVVATLLTLAEEPDSASTRPTLEALIEPLGRDALRALILKRAEEETDLAGWIEAELAVAIRPGRAAPVDPTPVAAQARAVLTRAGRRDEWDGRRARGDAEALRALAGKAVPHMEARDGRSALRILEAVAAPFVEDWLDEGHDSDEDSYLLFRDLGRLMAEAALLSDLDAAEREELVGTLEAWDSDLADYGVEDGFAVAIRALETGWDDPALEAILAGAPGPWPPEEADDLAELELTEIRLRALDAQGRAESYLTLARAAGAQAAVAVMLARLGRIAEALAHARESFSLPDESLRLATALAEGGFMEEAFLVAEAGLGLAERRAEEPWRPGSAIAPLAFWLREAAQEAGRRDLALTAARAAFAQSLFREDFGAARALAGAEWGEVRRDLLGRLIAADWAAERIDILLDEGMVDEAVASVGEAPGHEVGDAALLRLMEAAHARHPDWVIRLAEGKACAIMEAGSAGLYARAAEWLARAAQAYDADGRIDDWADRIEGLIATHRRKHKLRPLLEALR